ncbi:Serine/threonine-protein kinase PrkC [Polystyrenella longa]|uniref:Serine/threonine-protein kinase PrkC n=1 Tax=Polystyrenella longa TaxID=2528007 RepID=A0A518CQ63_9PLAN|nr:protein kinase [Polystyrenella longa]QDU81370.1 Serine/threonine-protein kinase PrkC [Polystyrenella longa]
MIDPPSQKLMQTLTDLQLCTAADIRRARSRVKRLARDLPAFDSIWLDALVQTGTLTPFQGRSLEKTNGPSLKVGSWLLLDELSYGTRTRTFKAINTDEKSFKEHAFKTITLPQEFLPQIQGRVETTVSDFAPIQHRGLALPRQVFSPSEDQLVVLSSYVPGHHLGELLTRRGRFPAAVVLEIARQLVDSLALLEKHQMQHGDLRLSNVRLNEQGEVVLINVGIAPAISPELVLRDQIAPDQYDGIAPELIGTGNACSIQSDIYALGCLLWQLLGGRPPHPTGDPLAKLAAHQTKSIPDVRLWAPDTPAPLAEIIQHMTRSTIEERPHSFIQLQQLLGPVRQQSRRAVRCFLKQFRSFVPTGEPWKQKSSRLFWVSAVLLIAVCGAASVVLTENGTMPKVWQELAQRLDGLEIEPTSPASESRTSTADNSNTGPAGLKEPRLLPEIEATPLTIPLESEVKQASASGFPAKERLSEFENQQSQLLELPPADENGRLYLTSNGPFRAPDMRGVGSLTIVGASKSRPVIVVEDNPAFFSAVKLTLVNVHFRRKQSSQTNSAPLNELVRVQADELMMSDCSFSEGIPESLPPVSAIAWRSGTPDSYSVAKISAENCAFSSRRSAFKLLSPLGEMQLVNCFKRGMGPLVYTSQTEELHLKLTKSTFRGMYSLVMLHRAETVDSRQPVGLELDQTLIELSGPAPALFGLAGVAPSGNDGAELYVSGYESFLNEDFSFALWKSPSAENEDRIYEAGPDQWDGVMAIPLQFTGQTDGGATNSVVLDESFQGVPRLTEELPGMNAEAIPTLD